MQRRTPSNTTNTDFNNSAEYKRFYNFCNKQNVNFKFIYEHQNHSWAEGPMDYSQAKNIMIRTEELFSMKPLPPLPVNYKGLYADQNKMCSYAAEIVKLNSTSGHLGEGIYFIFLSIFESNLISQAVALSFKLPFLERNYLPNWTNYSRGTSARTP